MVGRVMVGQRVCLLLFVFISTIGQRDGRTRLESNALRFSNCLLFRTRWYHLPRVLVGVALFLDTPS